MNTNLEEAEYLDFYLREMFPLNFAIMLDGDWGSGKTFFIKKYRQSREGKENDPRKFLYISVYGVSEFSEVNEQIFQKLHPFLSSKPVTSVSYP